VNGKTQHDVVWGLEIGGSAVRLIRLTRTGSAYRADRYAEAALDDRFSGAAGPAAALGRLGVQRIEEPVVVCLRDELVLHRTVELPDADPAALAEMIAGQLEVLIPTQADQFVSGFHGYAAPSGDGMRNVWVAAAKADIVNRAAEGRRRLGRRPDRIVPSLSAVAAVWAHLGGDDGPVALIDVAAGCTAVAAACGGRVLGCGVVDEGVDRWIERIAEKSGVTAVEAQAAVLAWAGAGETPDGPAAEELRDAIADWARHLKEVFGHCISQLPAGSRPKRAVLFGRGGAVADVADAVAAALGIEADAADVPAQLQLPEGVSFDRAAPAVGAALCAMAPDVPAIDLMTVEPARPTGRTALWKWAAIVGWIVLAALGLYGQDRSHAGRLEVALDEVQTQTARQGGLTRQKAIGDYLETMGPTSLDLLDRLSELLGEKTMLTSLNHSRNRTGSLLTIAGLAPNPQAMPKMLTDLGALGDVTGEGRPDKGKFRFEIRIVIDQSVARIVRRDTSPSATQPAGESEATTKPATQPAGAAGPPAAPAPTSAEPDRPEPDRHPPEPPPGEAEARARAQARAAAARAEAEAAMKAKIEAMKAEAVKRRGGVEGRGDRQ